MIRAIFNSTEPIGITAFLVIGSLLPVLLFRISPVLFAGSIIILIMMAAWIIVNLGLQTGLIKVIAFSLPLSVEVPLWQGSMMFFPTEPMIVLAACVLLFEFLINPKEFIKLPVFKEFKWIALLIGIYLLTIPFSSLPLISAKFSFINLLYILVFYIFLSKLFSYHYQLYSQVMLLYTIGLIVVLFWSIYQFHDWEWNRVVVRGIFAPFYKDHTIFGASAAFLVAIWFGFLASTKNRFTFFINLLGCILLVAAVLLTNSRAAFLSLFVCILVYFFLWLKLSPKSIIAVASGLVILLIILHKPIIERFQNSEAISYGSHSDLAERTRSVTNIQTDVSNIERLNRWVSAIRMFKEKPLTGFGPGTYQFAYIPYQEPTLKNRLTVIDPNAIPEGSGGTAHSEYLLALSEMGFLGLLAWFIILGRWAFIAIFANNKLAFSLNIVASFTALTTYFFHANFNNFLTTDKFAFLFWATAAWLITNYYNQQTWIKTIINK